MQVLEKLLFINQTIEEFNEEIEYIIFINTV